MPLQFDYPVLNFAKSKQSHDYCINRVQMYWFVRVSVCVYDDLAFVEMYLPSA